MHQLNSRKGTRLVKHASRNIRPKLEVYIKQKIQKLLNVGFVKHIQYPTWLANIVPVKKKNEQIPCCIDFREVIKACPNDKFSLPNIDMLVESTPEVDVSFTDGFSGYNQIKMDPLDVEKTAFRLLWLISITLACLSVSRMLISITLACLYEPWLLFFMMCCMIA